MSANGYPTCGIAGCENPVPNNPDDRWRRFIDGNLVDICDECAKKSVGKDIFDEYPPGWTR